MIGKCVTKCDSNCARRSPPKHYKKQHLLLRNGVFYFTMEIQGKPGKRCVLRKSLCTDNFFIAQTLARKMAEMLKMTFLKITNHDFDTIMSLMQKIICVTDRSNGCVTMYDLVHMTSVPDRKIISKRSDPSAVCELFGWLGRLFEAKHSPDSYDDTQRKIIEVSCEYSTGITKFVVSAMEIQVLELPGVRDIVKDMVYAAGHPNAGAERPMVESDKFVPSVPTKEYTIAEMRDLLFAKYTNHNTLKKRKEQMNSILGFAGLKEIDLYSHLHNFDKVKETVNNISESAGKGDWKNERLRLLRELLEFATRIDPAQYQSNVLPLIVMVQKTKKSEKQSYKPFSTEDLKKLFGIRSAFAWKNMKQPDADQTIPDKHDERCLFACLVALFTAGRTNATLTLKYKDIKQDPNTGIWCFEFIDDNTAGENIKQLKTADTERLVPIHRHLLDLGLVEYVQRRKELLKAKDNDFIFDATVTRNNNYNGKFYRTLGELLKALGLKKESKDGVAFHSFRGTASVFMQNVGISVGYINKIGGWKGSGTVEDSYSNFTMQQKKEKIDSVDYGLGEEFAYWKDYLAKLPLIPKSNERKSKKIKKKQ